VAVILVGAPFLWVGLAYAGGGPSGGQVVSGVGSIQQSGATTTIRQGSPTLQLNWQSFNVGAGQTVDFVQPGSNSLAVNRILGSTPSAILGKLNANGQVWLINPNGVLFGPSARVNVGGIVASTLDVDPGSLSSNTRRFSGSGQGSVVNQGTITAADGGYVALLGNRVSNQGVISARTARSRWQAAARPPSRSTARGSYTFRSMPARSITWRKTANCWSPMAGR
jgi:filamentous hemagglutinin family protein